MVPRQARELLEVAATFAGTVIGAGFASGQEITQFFVSYGLHGLAGILVGTFLLAWLGAALLEFGYRFKICAYYDAIYQLCGRRFGSLFDAATAVFLFAILAIMLAGAATVFRDYFGLHYIAGLAVAGFTVGLTALYGVRGISAANMVVTPLLVVAILTISLYSFSYHEFSTSMLTFGIDSDVSRPAPHWLIGSLLYVSYNLVLGSTVLIPLGNRIEKRRARLLGSLLGGVTLGLLMLVVSAVLMIHQPHLADYEVPLLQLAAKQHYFSSILYAFALLAAMYTTAAASLYGCLTRAQAAARVQPLWLVAAITVAAGYFGQVGFAGLIQLLFPVFGYAALLFTARLIVLACRGS